MSPRVTSMLISLFASSALLLTSSAGAAPKKTKADTAKEQAAKEQAEKEQADKEAAEKAQAEKDASEKEQADKQKADEEASKEQADKDAKEKSDKDAQIAEAEAGSSPVEQPGKTYYGVGLRYRGIIVPTFMMRIFGSGGTTILANGFGPEFVIRKDHFEYEFSLLYTGYGMSPTPFKAKTDGPEAWEIVESKLKVLYLGVDFNWSHEFNPQLALQYGGGAGVGIVWGPLYRTQAYPATPGANPDTGEGFEACKGPGNPNASYCGNDNNHYNGYTEPNWANGGSKPIIFPWLAVQTGLRYKPHRNFIARLDLGFATSGFFFGLGADYGL